MVCPIIFFSFFLSLCYTINVILNISFMLDMVQYVREKILRKPAPSIAGEELSEKSTTKLGYFLLFCMFFAIVSSAQWTLSVIKSIPDRPTAISYCVTDMLGVFDTKNVDNAYMYQYDSRRYNCNLRSAKNPEFDFTDEYNALVAPADKIKELKSSVQQFERNLQTNEKTQLRNREDYNTALIEDIANQWGIYDSTTLQQDIQVSDSRANQLNIEISRINQEIARIKSENAGIVWTLKIQVEIAQEKYRLAYLMYRMYIAALSFLFSILVFTVLYKMYNRRKAQNSPNTVIFSVATFAYGLVLLQISALFIWDIIPKKLAELIISLLGSFTPLIFLVQFLWPLVIVWIFWFLVYKIQARLYSPTNVLKRFISDKKCPNCGNTVHLDKAFCPLCSYEIQENCGTCNELTLKWMPYCSSCGAKRDTRSSFYDDKKVFDDSVAKLLDTIDVSAYDSVQFIPKDWRIFSSKRKNIIKIALFLSEKLDKTSFEANELLQYTEQFLKHIQSDVISEKELSKILWKIHSWIASWWDLKIIAKK